MNSFGLYHFCWHCLCWWRRIRSSVLIPRSAVGNIRNIDQRWSGLNQGRWTNSCVWPRLFLFRNGQSDSTHGIYDLKLNEGYLSLGNSHEGSRVCSGQFRVVVGNNWQIWVSKSDENLDIMWQWRSQWLPASFIQEMFAKVGAKNRQKVRDNALSALLFQV